MDIPVLEILFPKVRAQILRSLFGRPNAQRYVRELARETQLALRTVQEELHTLTSIGLLTSYTNGYYRFYRPHAGHPLAREIRRIVEIGERLPHLVRPHIRLRKTRSRKKRGNKSRRMPPRTSELNWGLFDRRHRT